MSDSVPQNNRKLHRHSFSSKMQLIQALDKLIVNRVENFKDDSYRVRHVNSDYNSNQHKNINLNEDVFSSSIVQPKEPLELSIMASIKQVQGNSGTLFNLVQYSQKDKKYHR